MPHRCKVIINPASGNGKTGKTWRQYENYLRAKIEHIDIAYTRAVKDASILAHQALHDGYEHIIAVGGDGTFSEVINGFFINGQPVNPEATASFLPSGTGSDVARTLQLPADNYQGITRIAERAQQETHQLIDIGKMQYKRFDNTDFTGYFCNVASFGMGGNVVQHVNQSSWLKHFGGKVTFFVASLLTMLEYNNKQVRVQVFDDRLGAEKPIFDEEICVRIVAVANGRYFGGGMMVAPDAILDDGIFDVILVENLSRLGAAQKLPLLYSGAHIGDTAVRVVRGNRIIAESSETVLIDSDGEGPGTLPLIIDVLPRALRFV